MRTRQLEVFHAVYTHGSITGAAQYLHVSQPSVSKVLTHTEKQLGFLLFQRIKRRLLPTPEAHVLFRHADKIHNDLQNINEITNQLKSQFKYLKLKSANIEKNKSNYVFWYEINSDNTENFLNSIQKICDENLNISIYSKSDAN